MNLPPPTGLSASNPAVEDLPPLQAKVPLKTYGLTAAFAIPLVALGVFWLRKPGQEMYGWIALGIALFCFLNVAAIRFYFDGKTVRYRSLIKHTRVQMEEVSGAKIGYIQSGDNSAPFFFLTTRRRGDIMLNLRLFSDADAQEFCRRLTVMGIQPVVAHGLRARQLMNFLYPEGLSAARFEHQG